MMKVTDMLFRNISIFLGVCCVIAIYLTLSHGLFWVGMEFVAGAVICILCAGICHIEEL
jgi:hypothetical protein